MRGEAEAGAGGGAGKGGGMWGSVVYSSTGISTGSDFCTGKDRVVTAC